MKTQTTALAAFAAAALAAHPVLADLTAHSYVQRGLVAQYDGIDNAGYGVHDPSAKIWKDLTGNGNNGVCANELSWSANGWTVSGDCKPVTVGSGLAAVISKTNCTIEVACKPTFVNQRFAFFGQYNGDISSAYGNMSIENTVAGKYRLFRTKKISSGSNYNWTDLTPAGTANTFVSFAFALANKYPKFYKDGSLAATATAAWGDASSTTESVIGGEPWASSNRGSGFDSTYKAAFNGTYHAFRVYDRTLAEDEVKVNAAVDAIRFNGASPGDFTLGGGWSFDGSGDLCVTVTATASGNGSVSGSATVKQYDTVTLVATPASGAVFQRWMGDTDAITSGSIYDATVTVTATDPSTLVAVFVTPTTGLNASSYIRRGLVANFDGIDNAGTGTHDSSATTWADLTGNGNDATVGANASWNGTDGWTSSADGKPMTIPEAGGAATTVAAVTATKVFTAQFAVKPSRSGDRQCFFGQWDKKGVSIEHNSGDSSKPGYIRAYYNYLSGGTAGDDKFTGILVTANEWASMSLLSDTARQTVWKNGESSETKNTSLSGTLTNMCPSVIGGDNARDNMGFRGTYHAFRLYNRLLSEDELKANAAIDDRRFNNGAKGLALPAGFSFDANGALMVDVSATATAGGKISYRGGVAAASVSDMVNHDGSKVVAFAAIPDAGFVFERWSGDTDLIATGSSITPEITLDPDRAASLVANFRRNGDAADGKVFDLSFTGDATADGLTFSATDAEETQGYVTANVTLPILPTVTNANVSCLYLPQPTNAAGTGTYRQMATSDKPAVTGDVATVFVRFRWDGPTLPSVANYPDVLLNGYTSWSTVGQGFIVRLFSAANSTDAYPGFVFPQRVVDGNSSHIENVSGNGVVKPSEWIDLFASVYPSPTDPSLSNADIWYCRVPAWNSGSGGYFTAPTIGHRHYGDILRIPRMDTTSTILRFGTEPATYAGVSSDASRTKVFRGAIAAAKGWNRMLSENEMFTVMAGFEGVQTFTDLETREGCTVATGTLSMMQGRNVSGTAFLGDADTAHFQRALSSTYSTIRLVFDAPKGDKTYPFVYQTKISDVKSGNVQPVRLDFNGKTVWSSANVAAGTEVNVELSEEDALPGLNELTWHYETSVANNWLLFSKHWLRLIPPAKPFVIIVR